MTVPRDPSRRTVAAVSLGLMLGVLLSALDQMIIAASLRTIADRLGGAEMQAWAMSAYLVTSVVATPVSSKLSDMYGRRPLYLASVGVFLLGSLLCGLATSMPWLAVFRAVQGVGAGGLMALALAILADLLPPERRVRHQAWLGASFAVASVAGPVLGGFFADAPTLLGLAGWRWAFLVNLPVGLAALALVGTALRGPGSRRRGRRVDVRGGAALILAVVPGLLALEFGGAWGWASAPTLAALGTAAVGTVLFVRTERAMGDDALLPARLFRAPVFTAVNTVNLAAGVGIFGGLLLLPLHLQEVRGMGPTGAGLMLVPQTAAIIVAGRVVGPLAVRGWDHRKLLTGALAVMAAATAGFAFIGTGTPLWAVGAIAAAMGLGTGVFFQVVMVALQDGVPPDDIGVASGLFTFFRQIGGTVGTVALGTVAFAGADLERSIGTAFLAAGGVLAASALVPLVVLPMAVRRISLRGDDGRG
ncbi:MFS transporter [Nocardiopsis sp. RSe5-2]|uniref:MFS transporter n=1 Tax=Nocardiopsis endophytica TaxID=3018445 RepID=A0ABT4TY08_9ACTN|nr:MFS transporter [Nocardiopsis endophytica]MDA2809575.1 MFS transporter [Nocardiopsis endophytica]